MLCCTKKITNLSISSTISPDIVDEMERILNIIVVVVVALVVVALVVVVLVVVVLSVAVGLVVIPEYYTYITKILV